MRIGRAAMERMLAGTLTLGLALTAASAVVAQKDTPTKVETARWAAGLNASSAAGKEWLSRNSASIGKLMIPVLNRCLPDEGDEITAFSIFVRLSRSGRVREVISDLDPSLSGCLTKAATDVAVPLPPRDDYWIQVNLAAGL